MTPETPGQTWCGEMDRWHYYTQSFDFQDPVFGVQVVVLDIVDIDNDTDTGEEEQQDLTDVVPEESSRQIVECTRL